ncbi:diol dehydratase reactivase subunit alpha, partial [Streptomyces sp. DSM 41529]|nr:diol dehydratase reactivase subunit alpha [Streptomyces sp. DSM 41529]
IRFRGAALTPTTGVKGTAGNVDGVAQAVVRALETSAIELAELDIVLLNEATPVISGMAMETITETIITESTMIGHDPRTPGGRGLGVGFTVAIDVLAQTPSGTEAIVVVPRGVDFEEAARAINAATARGLAVRGVILANDDAVLVWPIGSTPWFR